MARKLIGPSYAHQDGPCAESCYYEEETPMTTYGTAEHAALVTHDRHPGVQTALAWLAYSHLPANLQTIPEKLYQAAVDLLNRIPRDSAELTTALNTLVEAKDWFMRAGIRSDQGVPGPVPRPATVVDPPSRFETAREIVLDTSAESYGRARPVSAQDVGLPADWREPSPSATSPVRPIQDRPQA